MDTPGNNYMLQIEQPNRKKYYQFFYKKFELFLSEHRSFILNSSLKSCLIPIFDPIWDQDSQKLRKKSVRRIIGTELKTLIIKTYFKLYNVNE